MLRASLAARLGRADRREGTKAFEGSRLEPLVLFSIATGVRQGELLALRWSDIDEDNRSVLVLHAVDLRDGARVIARPKSERAHRTIRLPAVALRALDLARIQIEEYRLLAGLRWQELYLVFPAGPTGGIRDGSTVTHNFQKRLESRGLEPMRWHGLRRVFAAVLQDAGVPLERVRDLMGHSQLQVTEHYDYTLKDSLLRDMDAIDAAFLADESAWSGSGRCQRDRAECGSSEGASAGLAMAASGWKRHQAWFIACGPTRIRTWDQPVMSRPL